MADFPDPLTGEVLKLQVANASKETRKAYAEGLIYEDSCIMLSADPGTGKSTLVLQMALQLSAGVPLFGSLVVPAPIKVYYIQKERPQKEVMERLFAFGTSIPINWDNLILDSSIQFVNLSNLSMAKTLAERIKRFEPKLVIVDPIGAGTAGLTKDEVANNFASLLNYIQSQVGNSYALTHHTSRESYDKDGDKIQKDKPFFGSQWLDALVTGHYHVTKTESGSRWRKTKDNYALLLKDLNLTYNGESMLSYLRTDGLNVHDRILNYIKVIKSSGKTTFTFREMVTNLGVSDSRARDTLALPTFLNLLSKHKSSGESTIYEILL